MRKYSVLALTAVTAAAMAGAVPVASHAAVNTYSMTNGGSRVMVVGGSSADLQNLLGQIESGRLPGTIQGILGGAGITGICGPDGSTGGSGLPDGMGRPDVNQPGQDRPDSGLPDLNWPGMGQPDTSLPVPGQPDDVMPEMPGSSASMDAYASKVVELVNAERAKAGLNALTVNSQASGAALTRAKEIERSFSHTRPDGSSFSTALTAAGVNFSMSGENIAYGQSSPEAVMNSWMNSEGHRANILNPSFTSIGVGHYQSSTGVQYWTQLFVR